MKPLSSHTRNHQASMAFVVLAAAIALGGVMVAARPSRSADRIYNGFENSVFNVAPFTTFTTPTLTPTAWLPLVSNNWCPPSIAFTLVPTYGGFQDLQGQVSCVTPRDYRVAVYIYVSGWWTKPYFASPLTTIQNDGSWVCDITTGGTDQLATRIAAFLIPNTYTPTLMSGSPSLPQELFDNAVAYVSADRSPTYRTIEFSGYSWNVKASETQAGPGPNYFSDSPADVWVDVNGQLHLEIVKRSNRWYCTEIFSTVPLGYGLYTFTLASRVDLLDKNVVLGLFTWDDTNPDYSHREIDIEFSRWGEALGQNAQFVVQPWTTAGNRHRFNTTLQTNRSIHSFDWKSTRIQFAAFQGDALPPAVGNLIEFWQYTGADIPPQGATNARLNLWLLDGNPPSDGQEVEVVIESFQFTPQTQ